MNPVAIQFASGNAFFLGIAVAVFSCVLMALFPGKLLRSVLSISTLVGAGIVVLSATPMPVWAYVLWVLLCIATVAVVASPTPRPGWLVPVCLGSLVVASGGLSLAEYPYHRRPEIPISEGQVIYVIGDSISAGLESEKMSWPEVMASKHGLNVVNLAQPGATVESALDQASRLQHDGVLVLLEIGGNDLLGGAESKDFERELDGLLGVLRRRASLVAMFELPLPPLRNRFGAIQRSLARKHGAILIPKMCMARVLGARGATVDGLHLSGKGHDLLAEEVFAMIRRPEGDNSQNDQ